MLLQKKKIFKFGKVLFKEKWKMEQNVWKFNGTGWKWNEMCHKKLLERLENEMKRMKIRKKCAEI